MTVYFNLLSTRVQYYFLSGKGANHSQTKYPFFVNEEETASYVMKVIA